MKETETVLARLRRAVQEGRNAVAIGQEPALSLARAEVCWALLHFDDEVGPGGAIADHEAFCAKAGYRCIVVSNAFDQMLLSRPSVVYEFAPLDVRPGREVERGGILATHYLHERLVAIVSFWNVVGCTWSGRRATEVQHAAKAYSTRVAAMIAPE